MNPRSRSKRRARPIHGDVDDRLNPTEREAHIRDAVISLTTGLVNWMDEAWGGFTHVKVTTDTMTGEVTLTKSDGTEPDSVLVRRIEEIQWAEFSFWRPLHQLKLRVNPSRQFEVRPFTRELPGSSTAFVFPMNQRKDLPRNRHEENLVARAARKSVARVAPTTQPEEG